MGSRGKSPRLSMGRWSYVPAGRVPVSSRLAAAGSGLSGPHEDPPTPVLARGQVMMSKRSAIGLLAAVFLTGCASSHYLPVKAADVIGPCQTTVPDRDLLLGV